MKVYHFDITPVPAPRMTQSDKWNERPVVMRYFAYRDELVLKANIKKMKITESFSVLFEFKTKDKNLWGTPHKKKPDLDNLVKAFMDALLAEDAQVWNMHATKEYGEKDLITVFIT
jgi:Holliday junction resolvase RusA-like endonuclease